MPRRHEDTHTRKDEKQHRVNYFLSFHCKKCDGHLEPTRLFRGEQRKSFIPWLLEQCTQETIWILMLYSAFHMLGVII